MNEIYDMNASEGISQESRITQSGIIILICPWMYTSGNLIPSQSYPEICKSRHLIPSYPGLSQSTKPILGYPGLS